jgi:hypothetical protein
VHRRRKQRTEWLALKPGTHEGYVDWAVVLFRREFEPMFEPMFVEPQEGLSRATEFFDFVTCNRFLHAPIRILLEPVAYLDVADWRSDNELSTPRLLVF